jgi:salicylate hydroxylase
MPCAQEVRYRRNHRTHEMGEVMEREYGAPYYHIHRADFHKLLYDLVAPHVTILLGSPVTGCDPGPSVTFGHPQIRKGREGGFDCWSGRRQEFHSAGCVRETEPSGANWRRGLSGDYTCFVMMQDPELREFIEHPQMTGWMAPRRHLMAYPIVRRTFPLKLLDYADHMSSFYRGGRRSIISFYCTQMMGR